MTRADVLQPYVEKLMKELLGVEDLIVGPDGTIPIRVGSAGVYVRLAKPGDRPLLHVYSPMLRGVTPTPELYERLNVINASTFSARVFWVEQEVVVAVDLIAEALDREELQAAVDLVSGFADRWDTELKGAFGGETQFEDLKPDPPADAAVLPPPPPGTGPEGSETPPAAGDDEHQGYL